MRAVQSRHRRHLPEIGIHIQRKGAMTIKFHALSRNAASQPSCRNRYTYTCKRID